MRSETARYGRRCAPSRSTVPQRSPPTRRSRRRALRNRRESLFSHKKAQKHKIKNQRSCSKPQPAQKAFLCAFCAFLWLKLACIFHGFAALFEHLAVPHEAGARVGRELEVLGQLQTR